MKKFFSILAVAILFASNAQAVTSGLSGGQITLKKLFDQGRWKPPVALANVPPGGSCNSSLDCDGFCKDGYCDVPAGQHVPPGGHCNSSLDCQGFCRDGYCDVPAGQHVPPGGHCSSSLDCQGFCHNGYCDVPAGQSVPTGGHCESSLDCGPSDFCHNHVCR